MDPQLRKAAVRLAQSAQGIPYIWGGNRPADGFDCSGFVIWIFQTLGVIASGDWTAQGLHDMLTAGAAGLTLDPTEGNLAFYGEQPSRITHVMMTIGAGQVIGACGGGKKNLQRDYSLNNGAKVQTKYLRYRSDLIDVLPVRYPDE